MEEKINDFIKKSTSIHGNKYNYSLIFFNKVKDKIKIICSEHGEFEQRVDVHLRGSGCPECFYNKKTKTSDQFIKGAKLIHGNKYDYSLIQYKGTFKKVRIICSEHGEFQQTPDRHLSGSGCPKCVGKNKTTEEFIKEAKQIHGDRYDYSMVDYKKAKTKIKIICSIHGDFEQTPDKHINSKQGCGCPKCVGRNKTTEEFIKEVKTIHGNRYDYSLTKYINSKTKIRIICSKHGEFEQTPSDHFQGNGCPKCAGKNKTNGDVILLLKGIHGDKYDYSELEFKKSLNKVKIKCKKHGEFYSLVGNHLKGSGCPKCSFLSTKPQLEIIDFIKSLNIELETNNRSTLNGKELDILIPAHNLAIEFDGLYWHNELHLDKEYHLNKTLLCEAKGIQLIHIFEDEWLYKQDIVKSRLKNILGLSENRIYGRKCEVKHVSSKESREFLDMNHIQGSVNSSIRIGLFYQNELVSLMTLGSLRKNMNQNSEENTYELVRFCNKLDTSVIGGANKLLKYFIKTYSPEKIISYADRRWSQGNLYEKLGFEFMHNSAPNYFYIKSQQRFNRFGYRKNVLVKEGYDKNKTEHEIMLERGIYRIYDCGSKKYEINLIKNSLYS